MKKIALIAHDNMKNDLVEFTKKHVDFFKKYPLVATGTTGKRIAEATGLEIHRYQSGPIGGDQQIGADIAIKSGDVYLGFVDRFSGTLILTGRISAVESAVKAVIHYFQNDLGYATCPVTKK